MKLFLTTNTLLNLSELGKFNIEVTVKTTTDKLQPKYNTFFAQMWGDFDQVRSYAPKSGYDARGFLSDRDTYKEAGIVNQGQYDMVDNDGIMDFYGYNKTTLDIRAMANGFKTNEAWLIVHELCHGLCQKLNRHDATHAMEEQGRLKELWFEVYNESLKEKISLLTKIKELLLWIKNINN